MHPYRNQNYRVVPMVFSRAMTIDIYSSMHVKLIKTTSLLMAIKESPMQSLYIVIKMY